MLTWGRLIPTLDICFYKATSKMLQGRGLGRNWEPFWWMILFIKCPDAKPETPVNGKDLIGPPRLSSGHHRIVPKPSAVHNSLKCPQVEKLTLQKAVLWTKGTQTLPFPGWPLGQPRPPFPAAHWYLSHSQIFQAHGQEIRQQEVRLISHILQVIFPKDSCYWAYSWPHNLGQLNLPIIRRK